MKQMIVKVSKVVERLRNTISIFISAAVGGFLALVLTCVFLLPILGVIGLLNLLYRLLEYTYKKLNGGS